MLFFISLCLIFRFPTPSIPLRSTCTCEQAKISGRWCIPCKQGYLAGVRIPSHQLFEALDAHGHEFDPNLLQCENCKRLAATEGFCDACGFGFWKNQLYFSALTYHLARGQTVLEFNCDGCNANSVKFGWCDRCRRGMIGNIAISNPEEFDRATKAFQKLLLALEILPKCEWCAVALFSDGFCTTCKASYKAGQKQAHR